jgi:hypothetical protein
MKNLMKEYFSLNLVDNMNDIGCFGISRLFVVLCLMYREISDFLDWKSLVMLVLVRKEWMFTIKALERSTSVQESRFVCDFKEQFAYVARKFLLSMQEIQNILLQHNAYISGSTVLAALVECFTSNDIDFYALGCKVVELRNAIVNLYTGKDTVVQCRSI